MQGRKINPAALVEEIAADQLENKIKERFMMALFGKKNKESMAKAETAKSEGARVKVLGGGCAKCNQLAEATKVALEQLGLDPTIEHVTDFSRIAAYGVMSAPALVIDGKVVSSGRVLNTDEVVKILQKVWE
jgi:small redox-active disulfide protein 2